MSELHSDQNELCKDISNKASTLINELNLGQLFKLEKVSYQQERKTYAVEVFSKGAKLQDKINAEQELLRNLKSPDHDTHIQVYFQSQARLTKRAAPENTGTRTKNVFGVGRNPQNIPGVDKILAVASGKGGVGKSTVSTNLAISLAARSGKKIGILDADIYGPSCPTMLGIKGPVQVNTSGKITPASRHGVKVMSFGFLAEEHEPVVWRGPLVSQGFKQLCFEVDWTDTDILILDLPPGTGDIQLTMIEQLNIDQAIIVTTPQNVALADAYRAQNMFKAMDVSILGVVENMAYYQCPSCGHEDAIFGQGGGEELAAHGDLRLLGQIPLNSTIRLGADSGKPIATQRFRQQAKPFFEVADQIYTHLFESHDP
ncbi:MAG: Mrp/NBP35 family ATP-binding protein [Zetaproteobacteria bacterium]|nr:Mrp/NBP35 family ATP-binding protein [Zetaproteobacteria bacterium]